MQELLWLALLFVLVASLSIAAFQWYTTRNQRVPGRLPQQPQMSTGSDPDLVLGEWTPALAEQTPISTETRAELVQELRDAGYYRPSALTEFRAIRTLAVLIPLFAGVVTALFLDNTWLVTVAVASLAASALGFALPRIALHWMARARAAKMARALPVAVDLLTLALTGGQSILAALQRVSRELRFSHPVMAEELQFVAEQAELRSLEHALRQLADRVRVPEVRNLALILIQSERLGTDVSSALLEFSNNFRTTLRQRAEAQANRASFWMLFPAILCLWIPATVILIGPVYFEFWDRRSKARETLGPRSTARDAAWERIRSRDDRSFSDRSNGRTPRPGQNTSINSLTGLPNPPQATNPGR